MDNTQRSIDLPVVPGLNFNAPPSGVQAGSVDQFNTAVQGLLQKYQQMGTKPFVTQGLDAQQEQANRISAPTQQSLIGAAPSLQNSVRSNAAQAVQPTIQSAQNSQQTFGEQLNSFGSAVQTAQNFMQTYKADQDKTKADAVNTINNVIALGGSQGLKSLIDSQPDIFKVAGLDSNTYLNGVLPHLTSQEQQAQALQSAQLQQANQKSSFSLNPGQTQYDSTGNVIASSPDSPQSGGSPKIIGSASSGYYQVNPDGTTTPLKTGGVQNASAFPTTQLQPGSSGAAVSQLQQALGIPTTGTYDSATTQAVLQLQQKLGIDYSSGPGYYGPKTMAAVQGTQVGGGSTTTSPSPTKSLTSGSLKYSSADLAQGQQKLEQSRGSDGYVDPSIYQQMYQAWTSNGGLLQDFLTKYPAKNYVNPANTWLPAFLMPGGKSGSGRSI